jgi:hypothetical protein
MKKRPGRLANAPAEGERAAGRLTRLGDGFSAA